MAILASGLYGVRSTESTLTTYEYLCCMLYVMTSGKKKSSPATNRRTKVYLKGETDNRNRKSTATPIIIRVSSHCVPDGQGTLAPGEER